jgi:hypothetical protein
MDVESGRPISHIKDDAGHADIQTTSRYIDADSTARHESALSKKSISKKQRHPGRKT